MGSLLPFLRCARFPSEPMSPWLVTLGICKGMAALSKANVSESNFSAGARGNGVVDNEHGGLYRNCKIFSLDILAFTCSG